jgi:hypothetical protein
MANGKGNNLARWLSAVVMVAAIAAVAGVCLHSLEEIHYLKTFFPPEFTVQEAFYAAMIELVKVVIMAIPLVLVIAIASYFLGRR